MPATLLLEGFPGMEQMADSFRALNAIGMALSRERNLNKLLDKILTEARNFTGAEGASIFLVENDQMIFKISQNEVLGNKLVGQKMALSKVSLAGYVACTGEVLNIGDAYLIPETKPYRFNRKFDTDNNYRTVSVLVVPMVQQEGEVLGVLQLINARRGGSVVPFGVEYEELVGSLASQAAVAYENAKLTDTLKQAYHETIFRLCMAAEFRDDDTATHIKRMSGYCAVLAESLGWPSEEVEEFRVASQMHDVGKLGIPDAVLQKPGKLNDEEYAIMKQHTIMGAKILANAQAPILKMSELIALTHHEKWDGTGYPQGLKGEGIPLVGRITAIADVFDALTSPRCYKPAFPVQKAVDLMRDGKGKHFDAKLVDLFLDRLDRLMEVKRLQERGGDHAALFVPVST